MTIQANIGFGLRIFVLALAAGCAREPAGSGSATNDGKITLSKKTEHPPQSISFSDRHPELPEGVGGAILRRTPVVMAVQKAIPAVVNIGTERIVQIAYSDPMMNMRAQLLDQFFKNFIGGQPPPPRPPGTPNTVVTETRTIPSLGSGVCVDERGYILTNFHVVDRASRVRVSFGDGVNYDASFVAGDDVNDLALLKINCGTNRVVKAVELADGDDLMLGETVIAMGNPFGFSQTVTVGVLSSTNRVASFRGEVLYRDILQTDAAVNPGNSGGPLVNIEGKLIGINVAIYEEAQNIGFAQPVGRVRQLLGRWLSPQRLKRQWLGFEVEWDGLAVRVTYVDPASSAYAEGIRGKAVIAAVNGKAITDSFSLYRELLGVNIGDSVNVTWSLNDQLKTTTLKAEPLPKVDGNELAWRRLGIKFRPDHGDAIGPAKYAEYGSCLAIESVDPAGPAAAAGVTAGRYVTRINDFEIGKMDDVAAAMALNKVQKGDGVVVVLVDFVEREKNFAAYKSAIKLIAD